MDSAETELIRWFQENPKTSLGQVKKLFKTWCDAFPLETNDLQWTPSGYSYDRCLVKRVDPFFDILILRWAPGSKAPYHDHASRGCLQVVRNGKLHEQRLGVSGESAIRSTLTPETSPSFMNNSLGIHSISNPTNINVFSIHLYAPCKHQTKFFVWSSSQINSFPMIYFRCCI